MLNQPMPGMTDTLEFVKNLWGGMNIPGAMPGMGGMPMPGAGLSVEDLDKKIADLKAVESWLNLNLGMLRGSIQALEIQRGTLATLKAMGDSMAQAMSQTGAASDAAMAPFAQFFTQAAQAAAPAAARPADSAAPPPPAPSATAPDTPVPPPGASARGRFHGKLGRIHLVVPGHRKERLPCHCGCRHSGGVRSQEGRWSSERRSHGGGPCHPGSSPS